MSDRLVKFFMDIVRIDSESGEEKEVIEYLQKRFAEDLGATCQLDGYGNLIAKVPAKNSSNEEPILLSSHADTVKPGKGIEPVLADGMIRSAGDTILGADDKAGIAEIYEAVLTAQRHPPLEIAVTREEEIGLVGASKLDCSLLKSKKGFLFDSEHLDKIVVGGPTHVLFDVDFIGKSAHAGMEPEKGISAIQAASLAISKMKLGRLDDESTANVGIISGGSIRNGVPERCTVKAECRSLNNDHCEEIADEMEKAMEEGAASVGATVKVNRKVAYRTHRLSEDAASVQITMKAIRDAGLEPTAHLQCGGTDASILNERGIETAVIGIGVHKEHTTDEEVAVADMERAVKILHSIFEQCA
ncbi:M20/M25/M40 family metallo-hydrolase [Acidobacteriota bacterium]